MKDFEELSKALYMHMLEHPHPKCLSCWDSGWLLYQDDNYEIKTRPCSTCKAL